MSAYRDESILVDGQYIWPHGQVNFGWTKFLPTLSFDHTQTPNAFAYPFEYKFCLHISEIKWQFCHNMPPYFFRMGETDRKYGPKKEFGDHSRHSPRQRRFKREARPETAIAGLSAFLTLRLISYPAHAAWFCILLPARVVLSYNLFVTSKKAEDGEICSPHTSRRPLSVSTSTASSRSNAYP